MTQYSIIVQEYIKKYSLEISQILCFYGSNIFPNKLIIEIDSEKKNNIINDKKGNLITIEKIRREKTINEELINEKRKYVHLIDFFDKKEYQKYIESFWSLLNSSFKCEQKLTETRTSIKGGKKFVINPFVFNYSIDYVSKVSPFYVDSFLVLLISAIKD
jgi:hypothetical protein